MNNVPNIPSIECPVMEVPEDGYYTELQSHTNVARTDSFKIVLDVPCELKPLLMKEHRYCHGGSLDRLTFSVWGWTVPEITVPSLEQSYGGQVMKFSSLSRPAYETIVLNFTIDNKYDNYFILWKWLNVMNNLEYSCGKTMHDYMVKISIFALDEYKEPVVEWVYHDAFITSLGKLDTSMKGVKDLESTFSFDFSRLEMKLL